MRDDFAVFILSHGRANNVVTVKTLEKCGYTGKWYIVIDNEDDQEVEYRKIYGYRVIQFDKLAESKRCDVGDNARERRVILFARNACFGIAKGLGIRFFLELDDDYTAFHYRFIRECKLDFRNVTDADTVFESYVSFLESTPVATIAMAQGGDFIGGASNNTLVNNSITRKAMNTFFCCVDKPFKFVGRINEDVNTYTTLGSRGVLMLTYSDVSIVQKTTQKNKGGMSGTYIDNGTYLKSFYSVMMLPSAVKVSSMGDKHKRIHHNICWNSCVPKILRAGVKK